MCRCFARVDVNGTLYSGFARVGIHVKKDDMT